MPTGKMPSKALLIGSLLLSTAVQATTLRIDNEGEPGSLDPQQSNNLWDSRIQRELFDRLVDYSAEGELVPGLAERWEVSDDGLTWTFHLRDAQWSDGQPITADDAVYSLRRLLSPAMANQNANLYYPIVNARAINTGKLAPEQLGVKELDAHTLQIRLEQPTPWFLQTMAMSEAAPLPRHYIEANTQWINPGETVVSGPFRLAEWASQSKVVLQKNPRFYAADDVAIDRAVFYPIDNSGAALRRFRAGDLDISYSSVPSTRFDWVREHLGKSLRSGPLNAEYFYMFNLRHDSPLADKRVREALNLAVRRNVITGQILGMGQQPSYWLVPHATAGDVRSRMAFADMPMEERMARAQKLMQQAGYGPDHPLSLTLRYNTSEDHKKIAIAIAAMWKPLGVQVKMVNSEAAVHYASIQQGDFQVARYGMVATVNDPFDFLGSYASGGSAARSSGYHSDRYDELIEQGNRTLEPQQRAEVLGQAQQLLLDDYALLPIYDYVTHHLVSPQVRGWQSNAMDIHPLRWVSLAPES
ncbi:peptide ABC transporter substrate-binding protein [Kushneria phosphatilytica]|uniref:Peptide ABC transporter substrate-binding protein n=2 Tax=Kushneria phosphatilytica TaxID=657387 RepID=A0A5C1A3E5_9GAMM|nr:peptide ABC transporter substrate-binding protein [Kushneria phosphatilytica]